MTTIRSTLLAAASLAALALALPAANAQDAAAVVAAAGKTDDNSFCGDKDMVLGIHDGFGVNGWSKASMAAVRSEAAKCDNVKQLVRIGQMDLQKSIADVNGMVAEGMDALVIIPDWGKAQLPSLQSATDAGVLVVPWAADPGGEPGKDYVAYLDWDEHAAGVSWANWAIEATGGEGNVVFLGGPAGNPVSGNALKGIEDTFKNHPKMTLLTGYADWPVTNWDAAQVQQAMSALLAKHDKIDVVINDSDGFATLGVIRAYQAANKPLPAVTSLEANALACEYEKLKADNPDFQIGTISGRNWIGRVAARKAIAAFQGIENTEPTRFDLGVFESTLPGGKAPVCDPNAAPDTFASSGFTAEELAEHGKTE
jgi:ribose transport system substrate-binding protein